MSVVVFQNMTVHNAYTFDRFSIDLENQGAVLLVGENRDSGGANGAGKSAVLDMMPFILYGRSPRQNVNQRDIVNIRGSDGFLGELRFWAQGNNYLLRASVNHSRYGTGRALVCNGAPVPLKGSREVIAHTSRLIGHTQPEFQGLVHIPQQHISRLVNGSPAERAKILANRLGLGYYDLILKRVEARLKQARSTIDRIDKLDIRLEGLRTSISANHAVHRQTATLEGTRARRDAMRARRTGLNGQLGLLKERQRGQKRRIVIEAALDEADTDATEVCETSIARMRSDLARARADRDQLKPLLASCRERDEWRERLDALGDVRSVREVTHELDEVEAKLRRLDTVIVPNTKRRKEISSALRAIHTEDDPAAALAAMQLADQRVRDLKKEIDEARKNIEGGVCGACRRPYDDVDADDLERLRNRVGILRERRGEALDAASAAKDTYDAARKRASLLAERDELETDGMSHRAATRARTDADETAGSLETELQRAERYAAAQSALAQNLPQDDVEIISERLEAVVDQIGELETALDIHTALLERTSQLGALPEGDPDETACEIQGVEDDLSSLDDEIAELSHTIGTLDERLRATQEMISERDAIRGTLRTLTDERVEHSRLAALRRAVPRAKQTAVRDMVRTLTEYLPEYSAPFFDTPRDYWFEVDTDDAGAITFLMRQRDELLRTHQTSPGEQKRLVCAALFAALEMRRRSVGSCVRLLMADEIFASLCPTTGRAGLLTLVEREVERCGTVIVTTHHNDVSAASSWNKVWSVVRENDRSTLTTGD